ncbi:MAG: hypothetical protein LBD06_10840 [Candidatus Accumulibacter sp.]|nr:hypothetical protein [Accumulibacter sp.]
MRGQKTEKPQRTSEDRDLRGQKTEKPSARFLPLSGAKRPSEDRDLRGQKTEKPSARFFFPYPARSAQAVLSSLASDL